MIPDPESFRIISPVAFLVLFVMSFRRPVWAPVAYMILVYCKLSSYYPIFSQIHAELLFAFLILARLLLDGNAVTKLFFGYDKVNVCLLGFTVCVFVSFGVAIDYGYSWDNAVYHYLKCLVLYFMVVMAVSDEGGLKRFIWSFIVMFAFLAYEPMYGFIVGVGGSQQMYGTVYISKIGILSGHVALANNMNQMIPIAFYLLVARMKRNAKVLGAIPLLVFVVALIGSGSRGGVLGFLIFGALVVFFSRQRLKVGVVLGCLIVVLFFSTEMSYTASRINSHSTVGRLTGLTHGVGMLQRGNFLGVGPGCFLIARGQYFGYSMDAHNIYGEVIGELGFPGLIAWFFLIYQMLKNLIAAKKYLMACGLQDHFLYALAQGLQVSLLVRLAISMASHGLYYFYWYVVAALSIVVLKLALKQKSLMIGSMDDSSRFELSSTGTGV